MNLKNQDHLHIAGIMTGNSMDAADIVLTRFETGGKIQDLAFYTHPYPGGLVADLTDLRRAVNAAHGDMDMIARDYHHNGKTFDDIHDAYIDFIVDAIRGLQSKTDHNIDAIGSHGQNLAHYPPSIAKDGAQPYTVQIGCGQQLADRLKTPVVFDFRSDDVLNGGEGAPLAPGHHAALAKTMNVGAMAFCNAGNTGNMSVISDGADKVIGFDTGPFNHFPNALMQQYQNKECDIDGQIAMTGQVHMGLLQTLFDDAVVDAKGQNYLLSPPPKSSDGEWYRMIDGLVSDDIVFSDKMRTVSYFSAYIMFHALSLLPDDVMLPSHFALCGGGWKNPVITDHFKALCAGDRAMSPVLSSHDALFSNVAGNIAPSHVTFSDEYGFSSDAMEARLFAHMAYNRIHDVPFTTPDMTGAASPTICGIVAFPGDKKPMRWSRAAVNRDQIK